MYGMQNSLNIKVLHGIKIRMDMGESARKADI